MAFDLERALAGTPQGTCRCDFSAVESAEDLIAMGAGCTDPNFVCPRLDAIRKIFRRSPKSQETTDTNPK